MEKSSQKLIRKRLPIVILLIISVIFLEGCWGKREVEELAFVMGMGIDQGKQPGTYQLTYQIARPKASGGSAAEIENWTVSIEAKNVPMSEEKIIQTLNKNPFVGTARLIVIGEDLARSGINEALDAFQRFYQFRRTIYLVVAKGSAKEILETELRTKLLPSLSLLGTIQGQSSTSSFPITRLGHYFTILGREGQAPLIPKVEKLESGQMGVEYASEKGSELHIGGAGTFSDGKLVDFLSEEEAKGYMWLDDDVNNRFIQTPEEYGVSIVAWALKSSTKYKFSSGEGKKMGIAFQIKTIASLVEVKGQERQMNPEDWKEFVKQAEPQIAQAIEKECQAAVLKSKELKTDFIGIGRKLEQKDPKYWKEVKEDWENQLVDFPVSFEIQVTIQNTGLARNGPTSPQQSGQS